nr:hypothetical protein [Serratia sp. BW106]
MSWPIFVGHFSAQHPLWLAELASGALRRADLGILENLARTGLQARIPATAQTHGHRVRGICPGM